MPRFGSVLVLVAALAGCDAFPAGQTGEVEEFVIADPGTEGPVQLQLTSDVPAAAPERAAPVAPTAPPAARAHTRPVGCPPGADVLYGGSRYCVRDIYR